MNRDYSLAAAIQTCTRCPLGMMRDEKRSQGEEANSTPAYPGNRYQPGGLAILTESPRYAEESSGVPLSGRDEQVMNQLLKEVGLTLDDTLRLSSIRCRAGERNRVIDYPEAVTACDEWLREELRVYAPGVILLTGATGLKKSHGATAKITYNRGKPRKTADDSEWNGAVIVPTFAIAYVRNNPEMREYVVEDLKLATELV